MKQIIYLFAWITLCISQAQGQSFSLAGAAPKSEFPVFSAVNCTARMAPSRYISPLTKAGLIVVGAGVVTGAIGYAFIYGNHGFEILTTANYNVNDLNFGVYMFSIGALCELTGSIIAITGRHRDQRRGYPRISIVSPKKNQLGLVYNF